MNRVTEEADGPRKHPVHPPTRTQERLLRLIAFMKFVKASLMIAVGLGALKLLDPQIAERAQGWAESLAAAPEKNLVLGLLTKLLSIPPGWLHWVGIGAFVYAGLFVVEGVGLWLERRWAEWLTVVATSLLVPFEIYELTRGVTVLKLGALALNLAVVGYLIYLLKRHIARPTRSHSAV